MTEREDERAIVRRIGARPEDLRKRVRTEARRRVTDHGLFPVAVLAFFLGPLVVIGIPLSRWMSARWDLPQALLLIAMTIIWGAIPARFFFARMIRDSADDVLAERGVMLCKKCGTDLRRFTWVPGLDPVCTECGEPFDQKWLERLVQRDAPIRRDRSV